MDSKVQKSYLKIAAATTSKYYAEEKYEESEEGRKWLASMVEARQQLREEKLAKPKEQTV